MSNGLRTPVRVMSVDEMADRIEELEAKLAKAVEALLETNAAFAKTVGLRRHKAWATINKTNRLLAELTGGKDE